MSFESVVRMDQTERHSLLNMIARLQQVCIGRRFRRLTTGRYKFIGDELGCMKDTCIDEQGDTVRCVRDTKSVYVGSMDCAHH